MDRIDPALYTGLPAELPNYDKRPIVADHIALRAACRILVPLRAKRASSCVTLPWPIWSSPSRMNSAEQVISMRTNDAAAEVAPVAHEPHSDLKALPPLSFLETSSSGLIMPPTRTSPLRLARSSFPAPR